MAEQACVIGAGTMGVGIAYAFAAAGFETTVVEPSRTQVSAATALLEQVSRDGVRRSKLTEAQAAKLLDSVNIVSAVSEIPLGCAMVVESVPERLELKIEILQAAETRAPRILATNTSALSVEELAKQLEHPEAFLGAHFFNPVWALHLVELVVATSTSEATLGAARDIVEKLGKEAAVVHDSPGFATSRLDLVASLEAMRMVEAGVASAEDIDRAMRLAYRHPVGPLKLSDIVGLDVRLDISRNLAPLLGPGFEPPQILIDLVERGDLGQKSGQGFYAWP
ncbi:3-hydroxyacyl-CoA dehydrogenase family protein [soil metagenome]